MKNINVINALQPDLKEILESELRLGNRISEISTGWWSQESVLIILVQPFKKIYVLTENIEFLNVDDPHYWKAEYHCKSLLQVLACRF